MTKHERREMKRYIRRWHGYGCADGDCHVIPATVDRPMDACFSERAEHRAAAAGAFARARGMSHRRRVMEHVLTAPDLT